MTKKQEAEQNTAATDIEETQATEGEALTEEEVVAETEAETESEGELEVEAVSDESDMAAQLEEARKKADTNWDLAVRAKAELENLRKRHDRDLSNAHKYALERFVNELLPVHDSLELGLKAAQEDNADLAKLRKGTELTLNLFSSVMEKFNVAVIDPEGEPFNPELHQAMAMQPAEDVEPNTVVTVIQKGYSLNERLVRPAMVIVSQAATTNIDEQA
jgi:molecular chaperone GrpE